MSDTLKTLIGCLLLVALGSAALDWQDTVDQLRQESQTSTRQRQRLENQTQTTDWVVLSQQAQQAQNAWLDRLVEVETTGVFRAIAMERMADLCKSLDIPCQVGAEGEKILTPLQGAPKPTVTANNASKDSAGAGGPAHSVPGLVSATVRVSLPVSSPGLQQLITEIETGPLLRSIEKFSVRAGRVDIRVQNYGMLQAAKQPLQAASAQNNEVKP